jgi:hypothetical protein
VRAATSTQDGGEISSAPTSSTVPVEPIDHATTTEVVDGVVENITTTQENIPAPHDATDVVSTTMPSAAVVDPIAAPVTETALPPSIIAE